MNAARVERRVPCHPALPARPEDRLPGRLTEAAKPRILSLIVGFTLLLCPLLSQSQTAEDIRFRTLSVEDGLSQSTVRAILRDREGFMWFGTQDGLDRYDGYTFTEFRHRELDSSTIADNFITCLFEDSHGVLWVGTYNGCVDRFDRTGAGFIHAYTPREASRAPSVMSICDDRAGTLWVGTWGGGVLAFDQASLSWRQMRHDPADPASLAHDQVSAVAAGPDGRLWVGTWGGLDCLAGQDNRFTHWRAAGEGPGLEDHRITSVFASDDGAVWAGTFEHGLNRHDLRSGSVTRFALPLPGPPAPHLGKISAITRDRRGCLWVGTRGAGVLCIDRGSGAILQLRHDARERGSLSANTVTALFADASGGMWVGTDGGGVNHYDPRRFKFSALGHVAGDHSTLASGNVRALAGDSSGYLWIGTMGEGLDRLDTRTGRISHTLQVPGLPESSAANEVLALLRDRDGALWIGTNGAGLIRRDPRTGAFRTFRSIPNDSAAIGSDYVMALCQTRDGNLWIGTLGGGLARMDRVSFRCTRYVRSREDRRLGGNYIYALLEDRSGDLWIGTWGAGLTLFRRGTGQWRTFLHTPQDSTSLSNNTVLDVLQDRTGTIWAGTEGGGLERYLPSSGSFTHITETEGLPNNVVYGMLEDSSGVLWISTNRGICSFDPRLRTFRTFGTDDGLLSLEFCQRARCSGPDGRMYFGGISGVNSFHPTRMLADTIVPAIRITRVRVLNRDVPFDQDCGTPLQVRYAENLVSFEFAALDYVAPSRHRFQYMLEGFDKEWRPAAAGHEASYTNLAGGDYVFLVRGSNSNGVWNRTGTRLSLHVVPPFWETTWFRGSGALLLFIAGFGTYWERHRRARLHRALQADISRRLNESQERERKRTAAALHDSLGQDLLILRNRLLQVHAATPDGPGLCDELKGIAGDVQHAIDEVREIAADLHPHMLERLGLTKTIEAMLRSCASSSGLHIKADLDPIDNLLLPAAEINLFRIVQEAVTNVMKHSQASECTVTARDRGPWCEVRIADDGCGIAAGMLAGAERRGFGMANMAERCRLLDGHMKIDSTPGQGTSILFTIPLPGCERKIPS